MADRNDYDFGEYRIDRDMVLEAALENLTDLLYDCGMACIDFSANTLEFEHDGRIVHVTMSGEQAGRWRTSSQPYAVFGDERSQGDLVHLFAACTPFSEDYATALWGLDAHLGGPGRITSLFKVRPPRLPRPTDPSPFSSGTPSKLEIARKLVAESEPVIGSPGEAYLCARGIDVSQAGVRDALQASMADIRFLKSSRLYFTNAAREMTWCVRPAILLAARDDQGDVTNIQQIFLRDDCAGKLEMADGLGEPVTAKRSLAPFLNPLRVPASPDGVVTELVLTEGPENALSLRIAHDAEVWACFGHSNLTRIEIPDHVTHLTLASDGDEPGTTAEQSFESVAYKYRCLGYHVRLVSFRDTDQKLDANDCLQLHGAQTLHERIALTPFQPPFPALTVEEGQAALGTSLDRILADLRPRVASLAAARNENRERKHLEGYDKDWVFDYIVSAIEENDPLFHDKAPGSVKSELDNVVASCKSAIERAQVRRGSYRKSLLSRINDARDALAKDETLEASDKKVLSNLIDEVEDAIREYLPSDATNNSIVRKSHLRRIHNNGLELEPDLQLVLGTPGLGKTHGMKRVLQEVDEQAIIWVLQPTVAKAEEFKMEMQDAITAPIYVVKGRSAPRSPDDPSPMCERSDIAEDLGKRGRAINTSLCRRVIQAVPLELGDCPHYDKCPYIAQRNELISKDNEGTGGVFVMSHTALSMPNDAPKPDLVIIDEDPSFSLVGHTEIDTSALQPGASWRDVVIAQSDVDELGYTEEQIQQVFEIAGLVYRALHGQETLVDIHKKVSAAQLKACARLLRESEEKSVTPIRPWLDADEIKGILEEISETEMKSVARVFRSIAIEVADLERWIKRGGTIEDWRPNLQAVRIERVLKNVDDGQEQLSRVRCAYLRAHRIPKQVPILALDGTADPVLLSIAMRCRVQNHRIDVRRQGEVVQARGKSFSNRSLIVDDKLADESKAKKAAMELQQGVAELVLAEEAQADGGVFVCSALSVKNALFLGRFADTFAETAVSFGHFGATRGINAWEDCGAGILVGRKQPPPEAILADARAFYARDPEPLPSTGEFKYVNERRFLFDKSGGSYETKQQVAEDLRCQRILWQHREAENIQAIDRVRSVRNFRRLLFLSDLDLRRVDDPVDDPGKGIPADIVLRWNEIAAGETRIDRIMRVAGGFLPLAPKPLHKLARREFNTVEAAKKWLQRAAPKADSGQRTQCRSTSIQTVLFRPKGQRGKKIELLVDMLEHEDMAAARRKFEQLLGEAVALWEPTVTDQSPSPAPGDAANMSDCVPEASSDPAVQDNRVLGGKEFEDRRRAVAASRDPSPGGSAKVANAGRHQPAEVARPAPVPKPSADAVPETDPTPAEQLEEKMRRVFENYWARDESDPESW